MPVCRATATRVTSVGEARENGQTGDILKIVASSYVANFHNCYKLITSISIMLAALFVDYCSGRTDAVRLVGETVGPRLVAGALQHRS